MAGTLIVAVRSTLLAGLDALPAFDNVLLSLGYDWNASDHERVWTGSASFAHVPASLKAGRTFRNETGRFDVVIHVEGIGDDTATTSTRAAVLGQAFEEYVADNRQLAVFGLTAIVVEGDGEMREVGNDRGSITQLTYPVKYDARLT